MFAMVAVLATFNYNNILYYSSVITLGTIITFCYYYHYLRFSSSNEYADHQRIRCSFQYWSIDIMVRMKKSQNSSSLYVSHSWFFIHLFRPYVELPFRNLALFVEFFLISHIIVSMLKSGDQSVYFHGKRFINFQRFRGCIQTKIWCWFVYE